ncbi:hypothetical protein CIHG_10152 [Coccidioides immitis H538.4]|uniref:Uncharacterized protein n=1 Tax=Coccidioides immitis H538.4 TaxID=396776 RepID=A0A0J8S668_COCIT|nr:hypothetical protein CIHG_10152 [Coccidioides immitis H538.4]
MYFQQLRFTDEFLHLQAEILNSYSSFFLYIIFSYYCSLSASSSFVVLALARNIVVAVPPAIYCYTDSHWFISSIKFTCNISKLDDEKTLMYALTELDYNAKDL